MEINYVYVLLIIMWLFKKKEYKSDEDLLADYKKTDNKEIFADVFKKHVTVVYGACLFYLQDKDKAQDATMELFEKLMLDVNNRTIENFKGWLSFVVRNHCISIIRKQKTVVKNKAAYYEFEYKESNLEEAEMLDRVGEKPILDMILCLPKLKNTQRICVELFYLKDKSYQEIVAETNFTINEVKSYIQNGKRNLKILMEETPKHNDND